MGNQPQLTLIVTSTNRPEVENAVEDIGWGADGHAVAIQGQIAELRIERDGQSEFSIRIFPDGSLILTKYRDVWETAVPQNVRFSPSRPWEKTPQ